MATNASRSRHNALLLQCCPLLPSFHPSKLNSPTFRTEARVMNRGKLGISVQAFLLRYSTRLIANWPPRLKFPPGENVWVRLPSSHSATTTAGTDEICSTTLITTRDAATRSFYCAKTCVYHSSSLIRCSSRFPLHSYVATLT